MRGELINQHRGTAITDRYFGKVDIAIARYPGHENVVRAVGQARETVGRRRRQVTACGVIDLVAIGLGGRCLSSHSDAVYDISDWLALHAHGQVIAMDWGLAAPVIYLTYGRVTATEVFGYEWQPNTDAQLNERLQESISQPTTLYLWRAPDEIIFDRSAEFKTIYHPLNLEETIEEAFYENSGRPILGVTRLVERGKAINPPK